MQGWKEAWRYADAETELLAGYDTVKKSAPSASAVNCPSMY
jgi:hypothetical protein